jgi:hypothetical protein
MKRPYYIVFDQQRIVGYQMQSKFFPIAKLDYLLNIEYI